MRPSPLSPALCILALAVCHEAKASNFNQWPAQPVRYASSLRPPKAYQGDTVLTIRTVDPRKTPQACNHDTEACEGLGVAVMPNPCAYRGDFYADLLCHAAAHLQGWPANHPEPMGQH